MKLFIPDFADSDDSPDWLCRMDEQGLFIAPEESLADFRKRLDRMRRENDFRLPDDTDNLPSGVREAAEREVSAKYGFTPDWLPAYCSTRETGHFSAGVTLILNECVPMVFLSGAFRKKSRHFGYTAAETLAHEMVHAARIASPPKSAYDEFFPCQMHGAGFRRLAGNLFRRREIPALFFAGIALAALHPAWLAAPVLILLREWQLRRRLHAAAAALRKLGVRPEPVLLRLSDDEINSFSRGRLPAFWTDAASIRRQLLFRRFALAPEDRREV